MKTLRSYLSGRWLEGSGAPQMLLNPATEEPLAQVSSDGLDLGAALAYSREKGGPALRALTFAERGALLKDVAKAIQAHRDELLDLAVANGGNTRSDAKFDVDGAIFTLQTYAEVGEKLGAARILVDGEGVQLGRSPRFHGQHVCVPRHGVAVHINAFNFPAWGLAEKAASALLAGMPVLSKPATSSAMVAHRLTEILVEKKVLPEGALSLLVGAPRDLPALLGSQDALAFTGSGDTGMRIRALPNIIRESVRVNVEADSLNAAVLGPDAETGGDMYETFLKDVLRDMTQKAGQKCTAVRRVLVPAAHAATVRDDLAEGLKAVRVGNPALEETRMGPLANGAQLADVREGIGKLAAEGKAAFGSAASLSGKGFFISPVLMEFARDALAASVHAREVFGPVASLLPYSGKAADAAAIE
jgi:oxepin-CoA hydrolase/3-oxo-5,6-dehydrosuberyl-CoA semialdehyde dehydrogenase